jgi:GNAT superfamily N-acetyltransferase
MSTVLHFRRQLVSPPVALKVPVVDVRNITIPDDVPAWLALRDRAMAGQKPPARPWSERDFQSEMVSKPWWSANRTWLAMSAPDQRLMGSVTLAMRQGATRTVPVVHWLLVEPALRRRGVGRLLMAQLERSAWDAGWRQIELETHAGWDAAMAFYHSIGYAPVRERSPR